MSKKNEPKPNAESTKKFAIYTNLGLILGVAIGAATENLATGIALGLIFGGAAGYLAEKSDK